MRMGGEFDELSAVYEIHIESRVWCMGVGKEAVSGGLVALAGVRRVRCSHRHSNQVMSN